MRRRTVHLVPLAVVVALVAVVALAQPKRGAKPAEEPKTPAAGEKNDKSDKKSDEAAAAESETPAAGAEGEDLGPPPPKRAATSDDPTKRSSPLNPAGNEFPDGGATPPPADYDRLLGDIAALRSRVAALTTTLFASKLRVIIETNDSDNARISGLTVTLDDGVVYTAADRFSADDGKVVYEHAVAPGHHVLGVEIERFDARSREYKTWQNSKFSVVIPESKLVEAEVRIKDDSSMAEDFPDDQDGEYDLRMRLRARVVE
jgi:hypothetical protein